LRLASHFRFPGENWETSRVHDACSFRQARISNFAFVFALSTLNQAFGNFNLYGETVH